MGVNNTQSNNKGQNELGNEFICSKCLVLLHYVEQGNVFLIDKLICWLDKVFVQKTELLNSV